MSVVTVEQVRVGVGIIVHRNGFVLLSKRLTGYGYGQYGLPGGKVEYGETLVDAAVREVREEAGIELSTESLIPCCTLNFREPPPHQFLTIGFSAHCPDQSPRRCEPEKSGEWSWYYTSHLPQPMFLHSEMVIKAWLEGRAFLETAL